MNSNSNSNSNNSNSTFPTERQRKRNKQFQKTNCYVWGFNQDHRLGIRIKSQKQHADTHHEHEISDSTKKCVSTTTTSPKLMLLHPTPNYNFNTKYVHQVACGYRHTLFLLEHGTGVMASGWNQHGQCGADHTNGGCDYQYGKSQKNVLFPITIIAPPPSSAPSSSSSSSSSSQPLHTTEQDGTDCTGDVVRVQMVAAGYASSYALTTDGKVYSWGSNKFNCLGYDNHNETNRGDDDNDDGDHYNTNRQSSNNVTIKMKSQKQNNCQKHTDYQSEPRCITSLINHSSPVQSIISSFHHCITIMNNGECFGWGRNHSAQLGITTTSYDNDNLGKDDFQSVIPIPTKIPFPSNITKVLKIACGPLHTLALCQCQQQGHECDDLNSLVSSVPTEQVLSQQQQVDVKSPKHIVLGCGSTEDYRLALGLNKPIQTTFVPLPFFTKPTITLQHTTAIMDVKAGHSHSLALDSSGYIYTWGMGTYGALGIGQVWECPTPTIVPGILNVKDIEAGFRCSFAIVEPELKGGAKRELWSWGANTLGELGLGNDRVCIQPHKVVSLVYSNCVKISAGHSHCVCLTTGLGTKVKDMRHYRKYFQFLNEGKDLVYSSLKNDLRLKGLNASFLDKPDLILSDQTHNNHHIGTDYKTKKSTTFRFTLKPIPDELKSIQYCFDTIPNASTNVHINNLRGSYETIHSCSHCRMERICMVCARQCHAKCCLRASLISTSSQNTSDHHQNLNKNGACTQQIHNTKAGIKNLPVTCQCSQSHTCNTRWTPMRHEFDKIAHDNTDTNDGTILLSQISFLLEKVKHDIELRTGGLLLTKNRLVLALKSAGETLCEMDNGDEDIFSDDSLNIRRVRYKEFENWYENFFKLEEDEE